MGGEGIVTEELMKFIIDLGSIGAICYIVYLFVKYLSEDQIRRLDEQKEFLRTIENLNNKEG